MGVKVTKRLLDGYRKMKREIPLLEAELRVMVQGDNGFGNSTVFDYKTGEPRPQSVVGFDWPLYERRQKILAAKKASVKSVETWINAIEDGQTRCIFRMFYIDGMTWEKIAMKTGYAGNPDYVRLMVRDRYLKKMKLI